MKPNEPFEIDELLRRYGFDELGSAERAFVLNHIADKSEYEMLRSIVLESLQPDEVHAPAALKSELMAAFNEKHTLRSIAVPSSVNYKPWLLAAASIIVIVSLWWALPFRKSENMQFAERKVMPAQNSPDTSNIPPVVAELAEDTIEREVIEPEKSETTATEDMNTSEKIEPVLIAEAKDTKVEKDLNELSSFSKSVASEEMDDSAAGIQIDQIANDENRKESTQLVSQEVVSVVRSDKKKASKNLENFSAQAPASMSNSEPINSLKLNINQNWFNGHYTAY
jgi:hypothetical protein